MTTKELPMAVEQLRTTWDRTSKCFDEDMHARFEWLEDLTVVVDAHLAETDPAPVDESWARSVAVDEVDQGDRIIYWLDDHLCISIRHDDVRLKRDSVHIIGNPTRGQVRTACRLFGVVMKEPA